MFNREDKKVQKFVNQCADFCKTAGLRSKSMIGCWLTSWKPTKVVLPSGESRALQRTLRRVFV